MPSKYVIFGSPVFNNVKTLESVPAGVVDIFMVAQKGETLCRILKNSQELIKKLKQFQDPKTTEMVVNNVYTSEGIFKGPYVNDAPDLFVGFNAGYRVSWKTALGGSSDLLIEDNKRKWSGDHLIDPKLVPGVIFINKKVE
jgi:predicted AlkP superfamily phosphohydrolase/phosphomutase